MERGIDRYHRQIRLQGWGASGQATLQKAAAVVIGVGALGGVIADLLTRAGVGHLVLIDRDVVEASNLHRQVLFDEQDAAEGLPKAEAAARRLGAINSGVRITAHTADFGPWNAERLLAEAGGGPARVILDGTDNVETRLVINDLAVKQGVAYVYGGAVGATGMSMTVDPRAGRGRDGGREERPCLRCLFRDPPAPGTMPTCDTAGVMGPVVAMVGAIQAAEGLAVLLGRPTRGTLIELDGWTGSRREVSLAGAKDPGCPCCGAGRFEFLDDPAPAGAAVLCGRGAVQVTPSGGAVAVGLEALASRLGAIGRFEATRFVVRGELSGERGDDGGPVRLTVFRDGRALVHGVSDPGRARAIHARAIGT